MIKVIGATVFASLTILLIGAYLSPDDLRQCQAAPTEASGCQPADAVVAVSGGDTEARTDEAVKLYKDGWAKVLIFSGAAADKTGPSNAKAMQQRAVKNGVPADVIITEERSENTRENAQLSRSVISNNNFKRVILVTSGYHQRRASIEFRTVVNDQITIVNHPVAHDKQWSQWWWITPSGWWLALSELLKIVFVYVGAPR